MAQLPVLCAVSKNFTKYNGVIESRLNSLFKRIRTGSTPDAFAEEFTSCKGARHEASEKYIFLLDHDLNNVPEILRDINTQLVAQGTTFAETVAWVHTLSTGVDVFRFPTIQDVLGNVPVSNARGVFSSILAEHVTFSMLYFNRSTTRFQTNRGNRLWERYPMVPIRGKTLGIVGYGNIAQCCAVAAKSLGVEVLAYKRSPPSGSNNAIDSLGVRIVGGSEGLDEVLRTSDFVLNVMPLTSETYHFFDAEKFAKMKESSVYINIGRGATQKEEDLATALQQGTIRGAAVDVFEVEPLPAASPLWAVENDKMLLTSHNADITDTVCEDTAKFFLTLAERFVANGELPEYLVNIHGKGY